MEVEEGVGEEGAEGDGGEDEADAGADYGGGVSGEGGGGAGGGVEVEGEDVEDCVGDLDGGRRGVNFRFWSGGRRERFDEWMDRMEYDEVALFLFRKWG